MSGAESRSGGVILPSYSIQQKKPCVLYARPGIDSQIKFSIEPQSGEDAYCQWRDAMRAVARLPLGIPAEFRKKVWLALADNHITNLKVDWEQTRKLAFNERSNPDDNKLGLQIVKDLHRTGCSGFSGTDNDQERAVLKRVLLAYARWNKKVGYCQGFNVLAALILDVVKGKEDDALKVMIYLVDHVLPESYFANNLRALSVDMAVFRDLLHVQLPQLSKHLDHLQAAARDVTTGANYEPPLTNVFTMQWFLTMFATCLPMSSALRIWDSVLLEGSEILLRTAVAIWGKLKNRIMSVQSADEFYTTMGVLSHEMLSSKIVDADETIKTVYAMAPLPFPQLSELREKYTYNITPFTAAMSTGQRPQKPGGGIFSDDDDFDDDDFAENINCFGGMFPPQVSPGRRGLGDLDRAQSGSSFDVSKVSPGAYAANPEIIGPLGSAYTERMSLDIDQLKHQYKRLRQRQNQAHIILAAASAKHNAQKGGPPTKVLQKTKQQVAVAPIHSPVCVNHLFIGRTLLADGGKKNKAVVQAPHIAPTYPKSPSRLRSPSEAAEGYQFRLTKSGVVVPDADGFCASGIRKSPSRSMSVDSSGSGHSTLHSSHQSGSTSDVSTFGLDSEPAQSDIESQPEIPDLIDLDVDKESDVELSEGRPAVSETGATDSQRAASRTDSEDDTRQTDSNKPPSDGDNAKAALHEPSTDVNQNISDETIQAKHETKDVSSEPHTNVTLSDNSKPGKSRNGKIVTDPDTHYVAALIQKAQKSVQLQGQVGGPNGKVCENPSSDMQCYMQQPMKAQTKVFNPFPGQHMNSRRMQNGVKLGLYSAKNIPKLETGISKPAGVKTIGRAQINACLHRQYMEELKHQAKGAKHS